MKPFIAAAGAFAAVHTLLFWLFWAGGFDFSERGGTLLAFAYLGLAFGGTAAVIAYLNTKD
jgi:hypothetical protein